MKIMLACANGLSTNMLAQRMQECANEAGTDCEIWAVDVESVERELEKDHNIGCILLGPQVKFMSGDIETAAQKYDIPVKVINRIDYGQMNAQKVLSDTLKFVDKRKHGEA